MSGEIETEAPRPRPLSGGLWTLFSWLRRDERSSSSESLSSAGSDRTVASFAFLPPAHYHIAATPIILPPPGPPTDSYKKRVRERNIRRQNDRDITLHRKYGLYRGEGNNSYDAFSLPAPRRSALNSSERQDRDRRATSESLQRRAAYVPGKRRAPAPPVRASSVGHPSLTRRPTRKRPAPQPPTKQVERIGIYNNNIQMNSKTVVNQNSLPCDISMGCKSEKYSKKDTNSKENKLKQEKNFLKQIFDNRKRNSAIELSAVKILPSISELDKQAAEIIESAKLKALEQNNNITIAKLNKGDQNFDANNYWVCNTCSRKNERTITICIHCSIKQKNCFSGNKNKNETIYTQTENKSINMASTSRICGNEDKQKLKEMLKEMKDSLPKRPKQDNITVIKNSGTNIDAKRKIAEQSSSSEENVLVVEAPTLRIGSSSIEKDNGIIGSYKQTTSKNQNVNIRNIDSDSKDQINLNTEMCTKRQETPQSSVNLNRNVLKDKHISGKQNTVMQETDKENKGSESLVNSNKEKNLHTPLRISSLLNPVYIPKTNYEAKNRLQKNISQENDLLNLLSETKPKVEASSSKVESIRVSTVLVSSVIPSTSTSSNVKLISKEKMPNSDRISTVLLNSTDPSTSSSNVKLLSNYSNSVITKENSLEEKNIPVPSNQLPEYKTLQDIPNTSKTSLSKLNSVLGAENPAMSNVEKVNQHTRRRDLVNQLEQSIAKGDEHAAAEAAIKLAQLRLSCSVLSFSSQIIGEGSTSSANEILDKTKVVNKPSKPKVIDQSLSIVNSVAPTVNSTTQTVASTASKSNADHVSNAQKLIVKTNEKQTLGTDNKLSSPIEPKFQNNTQKSQNEASTSKDVKNGNDIVTIAVWVEDKEAARGPVQLRISRQARLGYLRRQAETSLGIASRLQRWIVGRTLCTEDSTLLMSLAGPDLNAPFYLCLVDSEIDTTTNTGTAAEGVTTENCNNKDNRNKIGNVYTELVQLEQHALVPNAEPFECEVCMEECMAGRGAVLRECVHSFCRDCLTDLIRHCEEPAVQCPAMGCPGTLHEREIRALVTAEEYERWLARGLAAAESGTRNAFHCRTRDCTGWAYCEPGVRKFPCPVCKSNNCVPCQAIHDGETCEQYRAKVQQAINENESSQTDEGTRVLLDTLISRGEALKCPECSAIITKKWGCDWVKCSACKTEICWVTRGRRWGPGGKGDTSGGCRCGIDGKRCHPSCGYCH
ncbi:uncharacterized protein ACR2FA_001210 [Aphomia sociella]